jgi:predicted XRE-type DNA-binding protein
MKKYDPYEIDPESIGPSRVITDEGELLKYKLSSEIIKILRKLTIEEALEVTNLNRADLSRLKTQNIQRFSIDRLIKILILLGQSVKITISSKRKAS